MHRSGTSLVAGSLEAAGLYLGAVNNAATYNRKGNKENESIRDLNERLLARAGAAWNAPPAIQVAWSPQDEDCAWSLIGSYLEAGRPWDSRTLAASGRSRAGFASYPTLVRWAYSDILPW